MAGEPGYYYAPGNRVAKVGGTYQATGTVRAAFTTSTGKVLYVFEFDGYPGLCHIFNQDQLEPCR